MNLAEVSIDYRDRPQGSVSKLNTVSDGAKVLKTIGTLLRDTKPFAFFTSLSLVLALITIGLGIFLSFQYWETGLMNRIPTVLLIRLLGICTFLCFFSGTILTSLSKNQKNKYEQDLTLLRQQRAIRQLSIQILRHKQNSSHFYQKPKTLTKSSKPLHPLHKPFPSTLRPSEESSPPKFSPSASGKSEVLA